MTVFPYNEMGVLTGNSGTLTVNNSEFAYNGWHRAGGRSVTACTPTSPDSVTINNSYFHENSVGHEIKSRALSTTITNSRIYDLNGTASYSIDLPNGGNAVIQNNVIEQGPLSQNPHIIIYGEEGTTLNSRHQLRDQRQYHPQRQARIRSRWDS